MKGSTLLRTGSLPAVVSLIGGLLLFLQACKPPPPRPWQLPVARSFKLYPIRTQNLIVLPVSENGRDCLAGVELDNGSVSWRYCDSLLRRAYYNLSPGVKTPFLLLPIEEHLLCLDTRTGRIRWQDRRPFPGQSHLSIQDGHCLRTYFDSATRTHHVYAFDLETGQPRLLKSLTLDPQRTTLVRTPIQFYDSLHSKHWMVASVIEYEPGKSTDSYLLFWDKEQPDREFRLPVLPDNPFGNGVTQQPIVRGRRSYWVADRQLLCVDLFERKVVWRRELPHGMLTSRLLYAFERLYFPCENERLYALDPTDGAILWEAPSAGTPSRILTDGRRLYLIGGSDRRLHVYDPRTGNPLPPPPLPRTDRGWERVFGVWEGGVLLSDGVSWQHVPFQ
ncbi:MAG: hypothetical protein D6765_11600 [Bacteroidetes bacterium]|nr:MAG: hypothetical protein D6765_11600 [Bacteroidota bacterium]